MAKEVSHPDWCGDASRIKGAEGVILLRLPEPRGLPPAPLVTESKPLVLLFDSQLVAGRAWATSLLTSQSLSGLARADSEPFHDKQTKAGGWKRNYSSPSWGRTGHIQLTGGGQSCGSIPPSSPQHSQGNTEDQMGTPSPAPGSAGTSLPLWRTGGGMLYLGHARLGRLLFQKGQGRFHVALSGRDVQGGVPGSGGQVGVGVIF